jgi:hypothetical protein
VHGSEVYSTFERGRDQNQVTVDDRTNEKRTLLGMRRIGDGDGDDEEEEEEDDDDADDDCRVGRVLDLPSG